MQPTVKDLFFEFLCPLMQNEGFDFTPSTFEFKKTLDERTFLIKIKFDGRGGLWMIDWVDVFIREKNKKTLIKTVGQCGPMLFPTMHSQKALDLANNMNLKALGQMSLEEKYPIIRIENAAIKTFETIRKEIFPMISVVLNDTIKNSN